MAQNRIILYYQFAPITDPVAVMFWQRALCEKLGAFYKPEQIGSDPALSEDMLSVSAAIRNRLTLIRMRRVLDFGE